MILIFHIFHSIIYINIFSESNVTASRLPAGLVPFKKRGWVVKHELEENLEVWRNHFSKLGAMRESPEFINKHFKHVNDGVEKCALYSR